MDTIKSLMVDSLNGFSLRLLPFFILQILASGFLAYALQKLINWKFKETILERAVLVSIGITILAAISKFSLSFAVLSAAAILLVGMGGEKSSDQKISLFLTAMIGVGCGVGSVFVTSLGAVFLFSVIIIMPLKKDA